MNSFLSLFQNNVTASPNKIALLSPKKSFSYGELNKASNQLAHKLANYIKKGDRVALCLREEPTDIVISILAILKLGGIYVPIDPKNPEERIHFFLQSTNPKITVCDNNTKTYFESISPVFIFENYKYGENTEQHTEINAEDPAYIIFTSGSAGTPKGVMVSHGNLACIYSAWEKSYGLKNLNCHFQIAGYSFDVFSGDWIRALCSGAKLVMSPESALSNPSEIYDLIEKNNVECVEFLPSLLRSLMAYLEEKNKKLTTVKILICGSDKWFSSEYFKFKKFIPKNTRLINSYGTSETTIDTSYFEFNQSNYCLTNECTQVPIGKAFPGVKLLVLDNSYKEVIIGEIGEIYIGGCGVSLGYINSPTFNEEKFIWLPKHGGKYFKTGDFAKMLSTGDIEFIGRHDGQVKIKGKRISLAEIENVLITNYEISEAAALIEDEKTEHLIAYIVIDQKNKALILEKLRTTLQSHLPDYMMPDEYIIVSKLPTNLNGKVDKNQLIKTS